jgi:hypothetical protein
MWLRPPWPTNTVTLKTETANKFKTQISLRSEPTTDFSENTDVGTDASARVETLLYDQSRIAPNVCTPKIKILAEFENNVAKISVSQAA